MTFRHDFVFLEKTDSTNTYASSLLQNENVAEGTLIYTREQLQGAGLGSNIWVSEPDKNITATVILYPEFVAPERQFLLTMLLSVSVCHFLESLGDGLSPEIKWPNDIYLNSRKLAGMLIKNNISGNSIQQTIAGLGLNVNQASFDSRAPLATSLALVTGKNYNIKELLTIWHSKLEKLYEQIKSGNEACLEQEYMKRFYLLNRDSSFIIHGEKLIARITGLGEFGQLRLTAADGRNFLCGLKEIEFIPGE